MYIAHFVLTFCISCLISLSSGPWNTGVTDVAPIEANCTPPVTTTDDDCECAQEYLDRLAEIERTYPPIIAGLQETVASLLVELSLLYYEISLMNDGLLEYDELILRRIEDRIDAINRTIQSIQDQIADFERQYREAQDEALQDFIDCCGG